MREGSRLFVYLAELVLHFSTRFASSTAVRHLLFLDLFVDSPDRLLDRLQGLWIQIEMENRLWHWKLFVS